MGEVIEELPKSIVRRVVKEKLSQCSDAGDISLHKDALLAFCESACIFIHYLSSTANDICKESKRQTMNADDVLKAIEEIDFPEFLGPLRASLEDYRRKNSKKRAGTAKGKEVNKKRKEDVPAVNEEVQGNDDDDINDQEQQNDADDEGTHDYNDSDAENHELQDYAEEDVDEQDQEQQIDAEKLEKDSEDVIEDHPKLDDMLIDGSNIRSHEQQEDADDMNTSKGDTVMHEEKEDASNE